MRLVLGLALVLLVLFTLPLLEQRGLPWWGSWLVAAAAVAIAACWVLKGALAEDPLARRERRGREKAQRLAVHIRLGALAQLASRDAWAATTAVDSMRTLLVESRVRELPVDDLRNVGKLTKVKAKRIKTTVHKEDTLVYDGGGSLWPHAYRTEQREEVEEDLDCSDLAAIAKQELSRRHEPD